MRSWFYTIAQAGLELTVILVAQLPKCSMPGQHPAVTHNELTSH